MSKKFLTIALMTLMLISTAHGQGFGQAEGKSDEEICSYMISLAEKARRIPPGLMQAIAHVESGRYVRNTTLSKAWPWTVSSAREGGRFYKTKQQSVDAVESLKDRGISNIDIGCMQVNLFYHGRGFQSVAEAINPVNNVAYATEYLSVLFRRYDNWGEAVKHYHSSDPQKNSYYLAKVIAAWQRLGEARNSPYIRELQAAQTKNSPPPLPPTNDSEEALAKSATDFADELRRRANNIEEGIAEESNLDKQKNYADELRIWDDWQQVSNLGDIKGKDPSYYIELLDSTF